MNNMQIRDNVLTEEELSKLQNVMLLDSTQNNRTIPWGISNMYASAPSANREFWEDNMMCEEKEAFFWTHTFHDRQRIESQYFDILLPLLEKINPKALVRIRANCNTITDRIIEHGYHTDVPSGANCITSIFYLNTNNGYTKFKEDGSIVNSVANRLLTFPSDTKHTSTTTTDVTQRIVINFNYF